MQCGNGRMALVVICASEALRKPNQTLKGDGTSLAWFSAFGRSASDLAYQQPCRSICTAP